MKTIIIDGIEYNLIPKVLFKEGDFVVIQETTYLISKIEGLNVTLSCNGGECLFDIDVLKNARLWDITKDAKNGDVLVNCSNIFIFHFLNDTRLMGYCHINTDDGRFYDDIGKNECFCLIDAVVSPATKEQRDQLEKAMSDAGYKWDANKKKLKKIEQKPVGWSEEDEKMLSGIIDEISANRSEAPCYDIETYDKFLAWLKSLKQRLGG